MVKGHTVGTHLVRLVTLTRRRSGAVLGLFAFSVFLPAVSVLLLILYGNWRVWPVLAAVLLFATVLGTVIIQLSVVAHQRWSEQAAVVLLAASALAGVPCCSGPLVGGDHWERFEQSRVQSDELYAAAEKRELTPNEVSELASLQRRMASTIMRLALTILLWQYGFLAAALGCLSAGGLNLTASRVLARYERRTTFVLASLALFLATLVISLKVFAALVVGTFEDWITRAIYEQCAMLIRALVDEHRPLADWVADNRWQATSRVQSLAARTREACALTIWEISLLAAGLMYFVIDQVSPYTAFRRADAPLWKYRLVTGALTFGGTLAVFFTVLRLVQMIAFWPVGLRFTL